MQISEEAKVCSPVNLLCALLASLRILNSTLMVTATKAALDLHSSHESLLVGENEIQHSSSPHWLLSHLEKEVIINAFQEPPGLPMPGYAVPPTDIRVVEVPHEDQGL